MVVNLEATGWVRESAPNVPQSGRAKIASALLVITTLGLLLTASLGFGKVLKIAHWKSSLMMGSGVVTAGLVFYVSWSKSFKKPIYECEIYNLNGHRYRYMRAQEDSGHSFFLSTIIELPEELRLNVAGLAIDQMTCPIDGQRLRRERDGSLTLFVEGRAIPITSDGGETVHFNAIEEHLLGSD